VLTDEAEKKTSALRPGIRSQKVQICMYSNRQRKIEKGRQRDSCVLSFWACCGLSACVSCVHVYQLCVRVSTLCVVCQHISCVCVCQLCMCVSISRMQGWHSHRIPLPKVGKNSPGTKQEILKKKNEAKKETYLHQHWLPLPLESKLGLLRSHVGQGEGWKKGGREDG
jgi:hypothetical protein